ncbi:MAG: hypothetical protein WBO35_04635, partial [Candidatus Saccharimonadales bacterium]
VWVAVSGGFSGAFDEYFHYDVIALYAAHWLPTSLAQPPGPAEYGAIAVEPSYLYHYLMSFPYRLLVWLGADKTTQIVAMRLIGVGFFSLGLYVFWRVLRRAGASLLVANLVMAVFMAIPVTSLLAGQLNYDTLLFLGTGLCLLVALRVLGALREGRFSLRMTVLLLGLLLLASAVKYAFLPLGAAIGLFVLFHLGLVIYREEFNLISEIRRQLRFLRTWFGALAVVTLVAGMFFAGTRYGNNLLQYHTPVPRCDKVISLERCKAFDPIGRDEGFKERQLNKFIDSPLDHLDYVKRWYTQMVWEMYFSVAPLEQNFAVQKPLQPAYGTAWVIAVLSTLIVLVRARWLWRKGVGYQLFLISVLAYTVVLFAKNYSQYLETGVGVAVHGRYLFPVLPLIGYLAFTALRPLLILKTSSRVRYVLVAVAILGLVWGGGIIPFVIGSNDGWLLPSMIEPNNVLRSIMWPFIIK